MEIEKNVQAAYEPEGQAIIVAQAQANKKLNVSVEFLYRIEEMEEMGLQWYILNYHTRLLASDCIDVASNIVPDGQVLGFVNAAQEAPAVAFGREYISPIAAIFIDGEPLYISPGFDKEPFLEENRAKLPYYGFHKPNIPG
jgi:hypothetical protein